MKKILMITSCSVLSLFLNVSDLKATIRPMDNALRASGSEMNTACRDRRVEVLKKAETLHREKKIEEPKYQEIVKILGNNGALIQFRNDKLRSITNPYPGTVLGVHDEIIKKCNQAIKDIEDFFEGKKPLLNLSDVREAPPRMDKELSQARSKLQTTCVNRRLEVLKKAETSCHEKKIRESHCQGIVMILGNNGTLEKTHASALSRSDNPYPSVVIREYEHATNRCNQLIKDIEDFLEGKKPIF